MYFDWDFGWMITPLAIITILLVGVAAWGSDMAERKFPNNRFVKAAVDVFAFMLIIPMAILVVLIAISLFSPFVWMIYCVFTDCR